MTQRVIFSRLNVPMLNSSGVDSTDLDYLRGHVNSESSPFGPHDGNVQVQAACPDEMLQQYILGRYHGEDVKLTQITIPGPPDPYDRRYTPDEMEQVQGWMEDQYQKDKREKQRYFRQQLSGLYGDGKCSNLNVKQVIRPSESGPPPLAPPPKKPKKNRSSVRSIAAAPTQPETKDDKSTTGRTRANRKKVAADSTKNNVEAARQPPPRSPLDEIKSSMGRGSDYLLETKYMGAIAAYQRALDKLQELDAENGRKFSETEHALLRFVLAQAFLDNGSKKDVHEAVRLFSYVLTNYNKVTLPLVYLGLGKAYYIQRRFDMSCATLTEGLRLHPQQKELLWPGTTKKISYSNKVNLKEELHYWLDASCNPPKPDAICRAKKSEGHMKITIYLGDPEFRGFVRLTCLAACIIEYHPECWKKITSEDKKLSDKDLLNSSCFTPDCHSVISCIIIYDSEGTEKRKVGGTLKLEKRPSAPKVPHSKTKPSSQTTIASRAEKKARRKQRKWEVKEAAQRSENVSDVIEQLETAAASTSGQDEDQMPRHMVKFGTLLRKEEDDTASAAAKVSKTTKKRKDKPYKVMSLGEFVGNQEDEEEDDEDIYWLGLNEDTAAEPNNYQPRPLPPDAAMGMDDFELPTGSNMSNFYPAVMATRR